MKSNASRLSCSTPKRGSADTCSPARRHTSSPYERGRKAVGDAIGDLKRLGPGDVTQQARLTLLTQLTDEKLGEHQGDD